MENFKELYDSYKQTLKELKVAKENSMIIKRKLDEEHVEGTEKTEEHTAITKECKTIAGMIDSVQYVLDWLKKGGRPDSRRGIERRSVYQRTVFLDPYVLQNMFKGYESRSVSTVTDEEARLINSALARLTDFEREIYIMYHARCISSGEIAKLLNLHQSTVNTVLYRSKMKFKKDLQLLMF